MLFNACEYLVDRRIAAGDGQRLAITGAGGELTYGELHDRVLRTAAGLRATGRRAGAPGACCAWPTRLT